MPSPRRHTPLGANHDNLYAVMLSGMSGMTQGSGSLDRLQSWPGMGEERKKKGKVKTRKGEKEEGYIGNGRRDKKEGKNQKKGEKEEGKRKERR